jgi:hypothetical protein
MLLNFLFVLLCTFMLSIYGYSVRFFFCTKNSLETFFLFRPKKRTKMTTFLEKTSCKYSVVIRADCRLTYQPTVCTSCLQWQDTFRLIIPKHQDGATEWQTCAASQSYWLTGQDIPFA